MTKTRWTMPFGAVWREDGTTRFRLWAPGVRTVELEMDAGERTPMTDVGGGWFETENRARPSDAYRFRLADGTRFPDPASRRQTGGVHGASVIVDPSAYDWKTDWLGRPWHEAVLYELHPGVMSGFAGIRQRLPEIAALGITAVELMPIAAFPGQRNWGYDGVLPFAPAEAYGTPEDLKALVDEAHAHNLMMFLDVVYNHFGPDGNYLHTYAPDFFHPEWHTPWGAAIAFDRAVVADYFAQNALYWLNEYRFDGLRFDAVHAILPHEAVKALGETIRAALPDDRHVHLVLENERNDATILPRPFDAQWNDDVHHIIHVLLTGEDEGYYRDYADRPIERLARALMTGFAYQGEHSINLDAPRGTPSDDCPATAFVSFIQNHDQIGNRACGDRLLTLADPEAVRAAAALVILCPQIPMLFMGEEIGTRTPFLFFTDHGPELADAVREGRRGEFKKFAAFQDKERRASIPDPNDEATFLASHPRPPDDGFDWSGFYRTLLGARARHVTPRLLDTQSLTADVLSPMALKVRWRLGDGSLLAIAVNLGTNEVPMPEAAAGEVIGRVGDAEPGRLGPRSLIATIGAP